MVPLSTTNVPKITELLERMDEPHNGKGVEDGDQAHPERTGEV